MPDDAKLETGSPAEMIATLDRLSSALLKSSPNDSCARAIRWAARIAEAATDLDFLNSLRADLISLNMEVATSKAQIEWNKKHVGKNYWTADAAEQQIVDMTSRMNEVKAKARHISDFLAAIDSASSSE